MSDAEAQPAAVLFDVDGTLYRQGPVRRRMALRIVVAHLASPRSGIEVARCLAAYRRAQEELRGASPMRDLGEEQVRRAAKRCGAPPERVRAIVERWMEREPLPLVAAYARAGLRELLDALDAAGAQAGVVSDYPAEAKLRALRVHGRFRAVVTAQDAGVGAFKPNPAGILQALQCLGVTSERAVYVGDREDVDGRAAAAAGARFVMVGSREQAGAMQRGAKDLHEVRTLLLGV